MVGLHALNPYYYCSYEFNKAFLGEMVFKATPSLGEEQASAQELALLDRSVLSRARTCESARSVNLFWHHV